MTEQKTVRQASTTKLYKLVNGLPTAEVIAKFPPQLQEIVKIIAAAPECTINRFDLLNEMVKTVKTGQPIERILSFYSPRLKKSNLVEIIDISKEAKEAAKQAKLEAAAKAKEEKLAAKAAAKEAAKAAKATTPVVEG